MNIRVLVDYNLFVEFEKVMELDEVTTAFCSAQGDIDTLTGQILGHAEK